MTQTPTPTSTLTDTPASFPSIPVSGMELGDIGSSMAHAMLGPFEVHDVIGRGGMGIVFSGRHVHEDVHVAVKVITRRGASHPRFRQTMHNEVRAVAGLDHPGVVRVLDYGEIPGSAEDATSGALRSGSPYFVMEMVPHGSLIDYVGRVHWRQARAILLSLLDALSHSHARDVIHRDIKPGNILVGDWGGKLVPRLADFGLAFATSSTTDASRSIGTPQYMAPEQIETPWRKHGPWSDLYSVGCVAFELLCGRKLFHGSSIIEIFRLHLDGVRKPLRSLVRPPAGFDEWLQQMLARNPQDRFRSAAEAARGLAALDQSDVPQIRPPDCVQSEFATLTPVLGADLQSQEELLSGGFQWPKRYPKSMRLVGAGLGLYGLQELPLSGRRDELATLWDTLKDTIDGGERAVVVHGAHGIGKSKLARAFAERLVELGIAANMTATHSPDGGAEDGVPAMLGRHLRAKGASRVEAAGIVREYLSSLGEQDPYQWRAISALVEPALAVEEVLSAQEEFEFASTTQRYDVALRYLRYHAERQPMLVIVDDAQFGGDTLELVEHILDKKLGLPIMFIVLVAEEGLAQRTYEREAVDRLESRPETVELSLQPLQRVDHVNLVENLLLLGGEVAINVAGRTAGNPGFAVGLVGEWVRRGQLQVGETGFVLDDEALEHHVPESARDVWVQALADVLSGRAPGSRYAIEIAAALGTSVQADEWVSVCGTARIEPDWAVFDELVQRRLVRTSEMGWVFEHPLVREAIRRGARQGGRWRRWKKLCAEHLQGVGGARREVLSRLGAYWLEAEEFSMAISPLRESARLHQQRGDYREAERLSTGVVRALKKVGGDDRQLADLYLFRAASYTGSLQPDEMIRWSRKALQVADKNGWMDIVARASGRIALAKQWLGEPDAGEWVERAYMLVDELGDDYRSDDFLALLGYLLSSLGRFEQAKRVLEIDRRFAELSEDELALAKNAYQFCRLGILSRDYRCAVSYGEEALLRYERIGQVPALAAVKNMLAEVYRKKSQGEQAEKMYRDAIRLQRSVGQPTGVSQTNLAQMLLDEGNVAQAEAAFVEAAADLRAAGRRRIEVVCQAGLVVCACRQQEWNAAMRLLAKIEQFISSTQEAEIDLAELLEQAGDVLDDAARWADAAKMWRVALVQWRLLGDQARIEALRAKLQRVGADAP